MASDPRPGVEELLAMDLDQLTGRYAADAAAGIDRYDPDDRIHEPHPFGPMWEAEL